MNMPTSSGARATSRMKENPMLGFRGASRYVDETFRPCFELECRAAEEGSRDHGPHQRSGDGAVRQDDQGSEQVTEL